MVIPARFPTADSVFVAMVSKYPFVPEAMSNCPPASPLLAIPAGLGSFATTPFVTMEALFVTRTS